MKRYNFPIDYKPKVSLHDTILYSSILRNNIFSFFNEQYKAIYIDPCLVVNNLQSVLCYQNNDRYVSFDNRINDLIACFNNSQHNYLINLTSKFPNENIITFAPNFIRDAKLTNLSSMIEWLILVDVAMPEENLNIDYFVEFIQKLFNRIEKIALDKSLTSIYQVDKYKFEPARGFNVVDAHKVELAYPTLSLHDAFRMYCATNRFVIIKNNFKLQKSSNSIESTFSTAYDQQLNCGLYVYDYNNDEPINLINIYKRPDGQTAFTQLNKTNPIELENHLYNDFIFDNNRKANLGISINFSNLLFYLLDKIHLAEVVSSVWPEDFIKFAKVEKIEIL